jgi:superfamily I DNA/RNA helicase
LIALELTEDQRAAIEAPYDGCLAILGAPGTGKSTVLAERANRARTFYPQAEPLYLRAHHALDELAVALLRATGREIALVDDVEAELLFARACTPLFDLQWAEFADDRLDPEVPGLRSPQRFLAAAFRLIRRLGDANVDPALFLSLALTGATEFYANPPNFADPSLLIATKNTFHDSLDVNPQELGRQYRREVDLAKIIAKLYEVYVRLVNASGRMTGRDAVIAATRALREDRELAAQMRERYRLAFVDDAQDLTDAQVQLLRALFGEALTGVTLCGDPASAISMARRTQPELTFAQCSLRIKLRVQQRTPRVDVHRPKTALEEAAFVAERVGEWLAQGISAPRIAVIFRSVHDVEVYERALLDANVPVAISGDVNLFADRRVLDALALLWNVHDPFRHEWLLRTLSGPAVGLSDASLATLCGEPLDPQRPLFAFDDEPAPTTRASRWNPKRDLRLGWNVIRGEQDDALGADAAARVKRFRRLREQWVEAMQAQPFEPFALRVWREGLARDGEPDSARALAQQAVLQRLLDRLRAFLAEKPDATTGEVLEYAQQRMESDLEACESPTNTAAFVQMLSVEAARGREFEYAIVANVRPGAFPLWYAPEAFLFSPKLGMIPKENAGDAQAARTAKFSYYMFRTKAAQRYNERERRALHYALRRASRGVLVTAWGPPTRGITAPELLEELR